MTGRPTIMALPAMGAATIAAGRGFIITPSLNMFILKRG